MVLFVFEHILGLRKACIIYCGLACEVSPFLNASQAQLGAYSSYMFTPSSVWHCLMYSRGFAPCVFCCITSSVRAPTLLRVLHMCRSYFLALSIFSDLLRHTHTRHCQFRFLWTVQVHTCARMHSTCGTKHGLWLPNNVLDQSQCMICNAVKDLYPHNRKVAGAAVRAFAAMSKLSLQHLQASLVKCNNLFTIALACVQARMPTIVLSVGGWLPLRVIPCRARAI